MIHPIFINILFFLCILDVAFQFQALKIYMNAQHKLDKKTKMIWFMVIDVNIMKCLQFESHIPTFLFLLFEVFNIF